MMNDSNIDVLVAMVLDPGYRHVLAQASRLADGRPPTSDENRIREQLAAVAPGRP